MNIEVFIKKSDLVHDAYGYWPSFHDAKIKRVTLGVRDKKDKGYACATLELTIHCFEMTSKAKKGGNFELQKHHLITFYFEDVEKLELEGLGGQNEILSLNFDVLPENERGFTYLSVELEPAVGLGGYFEAIHAEVLSIEKCDENGSLTKN